MAALMIIFGGVAGSFLFAVLPGVARGDGDPASDVLATQPLFLAADAGASVAEQSQLSGLLSSAASSGYAIRVALIASSTDLGSVTELWGKPQSYAEFLGQELSLVYRGPLLVVMPDGFGLYGAGAGGVVAGGRAALSGVRINGGAGSLAEAALTAVQRVAAAAGHQLAIPAAANQSGSSGSSNPVAIVAFALGALLIALAWAMSLRARPLALRRSRTPNREASA